MKCRILFFICLSACFPVVHGQPEGSGPQDKEDPDDKNADDPMESDPTATPLDTFSPTPFDFIDSNSTEPSESPSALPFNNDDQTSSPTTSSDGDPQLSSSPTNAPSGLGAPSTQPNPLPPIALENCAGQPCDREDSDACSCRSGLECRQRGIGIFICSQVSRAERTRLSTADGIGGAAGRDRRGRVPVGARA